MTKLKAFADDKLDIANLLILTNSLKDREENTVEKKKCWLPAFSSFPTVFSKPFSLGSFKVVIVW